MYSGFGNKFLSSCSGVKPVFFTASDVKVDNGFDHNKVISHLERVRSLITGSFWYSPNYVVHNVLSDLAFIHSEKIHIRRKAPEFLYLRSLYKDISRLERGAIPSWVSANKNSILNAVDNIIRGKVSLDNDMFLPYLKYLLMLRAADVSDYIKFPGNVEGYEAIKSKDYKYFTRLLKEVYVPIADTTGMLDVYNRLRELYSYLEFPALYHQVSYFMGSKKKELGVEREKIRNVLVEVLKEHDFPLVHLGNDLNAVMSRVKGIGSIVPKLAGKNVKYVDDFDIINSLGDIIAFTIVFDAEDEDELREYINLFKEAVIKDGHFEKIIEKDYIKVPKENGYKSYHIKFRDVDNGLIFEIQFKNKDMFLASKIGRWNHAYIRSDKIDISNLMEMAFLSFLNKFKDSEITNESIKEDSSYLVTLKNIDNGVTDYISIAKNSSTYADVVAMIYQLHLNEFNVLPMIQLYNNDGPIDVISDEVRQTYIKYRLISSETVDRNYLISVINQCSMKSKYDFIRSLKLKNIF